MDKWEKGKGFTLIELLIAIVIIGILMSLLVPAVTKVMENARRVRGANCLKQIAMAYAQYCNDDVNGRNINLTGDLNGVKWAEELAKAGYLNDPTMYCFSGDSGASKVTKKTIVDNSTLKLLHPWGEDNNVEFSVYLINNVPTDAPPTTTPIAFTRKLPSVSNDSGAVDDNEVLSRWPSDGVYGGKGGYIAYLDGHVEWYEDLGKKGEGEGKLVTWGGGGTTNLIEETVPETAQILSASKQVK
ncbi:MAG: type II secretion system GspH family protein [Puniceicoccales bacterium]|jgi:prepilin-type N-terminal cleavage/methylation domain-containing protein/prepilin-type processing-associated H-X9-DG protein|nr:type II secretion system GspH family protein [Puniceicoccales bacterium]